MRSPMSRKVIMACVVAFYGACMLLSHLVWDCTGPSLFIGGLFWFSAIGLPVAYIGAYVENRKKKKP